MRKWLLPMLMLVAFAATVAPAQEKPEVVLGGKVLMVLRATAGGKTPLERAVILRQRCVDILSDPGVTEDHVKIITPKKGGEPAIYVGKHIFVTVSRADAEANKVDMQTLAKIWARNLREGLSIARVHRPEEKF